MPSVEIRFDVIGVPHTFIVVTDLNGVQHSFGFAPYTEGSLGDAGWIYDDFGHDYQFSTGEIPLTLDQYSNLLGYIQQSLENPPPYSAPFGSHCATWAYNALVAAGLPHFAQPNMTPDNAIQDLLETLIWNPYTQAINAAVTSLYHYARNARSLFFRDPLTLDLDGDGIETVGIDPNRPILFDHDGDGIKSATGWIHPDDGLLVLDRNGNGVIDNGGELFGDSTLIPDGSGGTRTAVDGFEALSAEDTNHDGRVDVHDANFTNLRIWRDLNQDGISQENELSTLTDLGIVSLHTAKTANNIPFGNGTVIVLHRDVRMPRAQDAQERPDLGTYTKADGSLGTAGQTAQMADVNFPTNTTARQIGT